MYVYNFFKYVQSWNILKIWYYSRSFNTICVQQLKLPESSLGVPNVFATFLTLIHFLSSTRDKNSKIMSHDPQTFFDALEGWSYLSSLTSLLIRHAYTHPSYNTICRAFLWYYICIFFYFFISRTAIKKIKFKYLVKTTLLYYITEI